MSLLEVRSLVKRFRDPQGGEREVLSVPRFDLAAGEEVALAGESGSGKTTFLHLVAGLLRPDQGRIVFDGRDLGTLSEPARDALRAREIGYVFQSFHLMQAFDALENVLLGMSFGPGPDRRAALALLQRLGLGERLRDRPAALSAGQQQRVAIARAVAKRPKLVLADEPTGSLDARGGAEALELLRESCRDVGAALLLVSHDPLVLARFERVVQLPLPYAAPGPPAGPG